MLFFQLCAVALFARLTGAMTIGAPAVTGFSTNAADGVTPAASIPAGSQVQVPFTCQATDPAFSVELEHPSLLNAIAVANNIQCTQSSPLVITLPIVNINSGFTLSAINISNVNTKYATSTPFSISAPQNSTSSASNGSSSASTASSTSSSGRPSAVTANSASAATGTSASGSPTGGTSGSTSTPASFNAATTWKQNSGFAVLVSLFLSVATGFAAIL